MNLTSVELAGSLCLTFALLHSFSVTVFRAQAARARPNSIAYHVWHALGEIELAFALWAFLYLIFRTIATGPVGVTEYLGRLNFTEPIFVFVILTICCTRPILFTAERLIVSLSGRLPLPPALAFVAVSLTVGPLLGSLITEPAAMAVTAQILLRRFYSHRLSLPLMYATLGLLFVNISVGGVLTPFAAPPVLMVAGVWKWGLAFMLTHFGWRAVLACLLSTAAMVCAFRKELRAIEPPASGDQKPMSRPLPESVVILHLLFLILTIIWAHEPGPLLAICGVFMAYVKWTNQHQDPLALHGPVFVALFLAGLVVLGPPQRWWLEPLITQAGVNALFWGAAGLTAITDNAALTYLGAQVPDITELAKLALVSGAVVGGGLTVVANAPNPAGYGILNPVFKGGIRPQYLFLGALPFTLIAAFCFWVI